MFSVVRESVHKEKMGQNSNKVVCPFCNYYFSKKSFSESNDSKRQIIGYK